MPNPEEMKTDANRLVAYRSEISKAMTAERTSLESALIPVSAYIVISAVECWLRHPELVRTIVAAIPAEKDGAAGQPPREQVNAVYLWSVANIFLTERTFLTLHQLVED